jgi:hypothetical protein
VSNVNNKDDVKFFTGSGKKMKLLFAARVVRAISPFLVVWSAYINLLGELDNPCRIRAQVTAGTFLRFDAITIMGPIEPNGGSLCVHR